MKTELTIQDWGLCLGRKFLDENGDVCTLMYGEFNKTEYNYLVDEEWYRSPMKLCKPILKTLDQMTEEDKEEFEREFSVKLFYDGEEFTETGGIYRASIWREDVFGNYPTKRALGMKHLDWLTRKGYDIRGWIDAGLAIKYDPEKHGGWI